MGKLTHLSQTRVTDSTSRDALDKAFFDAMEREKTRDARADRAFADSIRQKQKVLEEWLKRNVR